jgi:cytosine/uracil/thiamine/allantoin permease
MTKNQKILLGIATLWPILYVVFAGIFILITAFYFIFIVSRDSSNLINLPPSIFMALLAIHIITAIWSLALIVIYIIDVFHNDRVPKDMKALWAIVIFFGSFLSMPIYWYLNLWREPKQVPPPQNATA